MFCHYCDNWMKTEHIDVIHEYKGKKKNYNNIPRHYCRCGARRVPFSVYRFMEENIDNDKQYKS